MTIDVQSTAGALTRGPTSGSTRARFIVHLVLIAAFVASLAALVGTTSTTLHIVIGLVFGAVVVVHLWQRRHTSGRLLAGLAHAGVWFRARGRLAFSDLILAFLTVNVLVSGIVDWRRGQKTLLPLSGLGLPQNLTSWHALSAIFLFCYVTAHVLRRRRRLRRSSIR